MIRIAIVGTGNMAHAHAGAYATMRGVKMVACCDIIEERATAFAEKYHIPAVYTDYREMLEREKLDAVSNVTPDSVHAEVALAVIARGLAIMSEKPLAANLDEARRMADAARKAGVINVVNFTYRNSSGAQKAAEIIRDGKIGRVVHVEASYLQGWLSRLDWHESPRHLWRLSTRHGSSGDLGDLGCHIYDMVSFLCGDIATIQCQLKAFDKQVANNTIGEYVLDANDSFISTITFANGALGTVHSSRWAAGQMNSIRVRVYGDQGALEIDLDRSYDEYRICAGAKDMASCTWKTVKCRPTPNNFQRFIRAIKTGVQDVSDFANAEKVQAYLHYSIASDTQQALAGVEF